MPLFNSDAEKQRKENLKLLEDRRLRFAERLDGQGICPERMLFCSREDGSFAALARHEGKLVLIDSPKFGTDEEFSIDLRDAPKYEYEEVFIQGSGLNGAFGFGEKGAKGFNLTITNHDGLNVLVPVVSGRNSWLEAPGRKNPLLKRKRRRGDANVMWDFIPIEPGQVKKIKSLLDEYYLK